MKDKNIQHPDPRLIILKPKTWLFKEILEYSAENVAKFENRQCIDCAFHNGDQTCRAFPDGIPTDIFIGKKLHLKKLSGQIGEIIFLDDQTEEGKKVAEADRDATMAEFKEIQLKAEDKAEI